MKNIKCLVIIISFTIIACMSREQKLKAEGNFLIAKIDSFATANHKLPADLSELGIKERMEGPLYYQKLSDEYYMIHFGTSVGESVIYRSETGKWSDY